MLNPKASVVIPTFNRVKRLGRVLTALDAQQVAPKSFEVVVVDDGSNDGTAEWLRSQAYSFDLRVHEQANAGPAVARNAGVEQAKGELIVFLDDDVVPAPAFVAQHIDSHAAEDGDLAVIGPLGSLPNYDQPWVAWEQLKVEAQYSAMAAGLYLPTYRQFWTGNASVPKRVILEAGGFNPQFLRAEDVELGIRLRDLGVQFRFNAKAQALHHAERTLASWCNMHTSYGRLEVEMLERTDNGELLKILSENFARLSKPVRQVVTLSVRDRIGFTPLRAGLVGFLQSPAARVPKLSSPACSLLANLLYWSAARSRLGATRFGEVVQRAATLDH